MRKQPETAVRPLLYSIDQTAAAFNLSRGKVYAEIKAGELQTTRIGDRQFTTEEQRLAYIRRKQSRPARRRLAECG